MITTAKTLLEAMERQMRAELNEKQYSIADDAYTIQEASSTALLEYNDKIEEALREIASEWLTDTLEHSPQDLVKEEYIKIEMPAIYVKVNVPANKSTQDLIQSNYKSRLEEVYGNLIEYQDYDIMEVNKEQVSKQSVIEL